MSATWTITNTEYDVKGSKGDNQITTLHWQAKEQDGDYSSSVYGSISIPEPSGTFIEYAKVTHDDCVAWCKAVMGDEQVKAYEDSLTNKIAISKTPKTKSGVPWQ
tara:strand:- start:1689 stop:2003 length:315 start_codon:yes stop_codon:yes gene_type:complete